MDASSALALATATESLDPSGNDRLENSTTPDGDHVRNELLASSCVKNGTGNHSSSSGKPVVTTTATTTPFTTSSLSAPLLASAASAVLVESDDVPATTPQCRGFDFEAARQANKNNSNNTATTSSFNLLDDLMSSFATTGFQATLLHQAIQEVHRMRNWRLSDTDIGLDDPALQSPAMRRRIRARLFLGFTSNQISSGQREVIRFLVQHRMVDVLVTTAGGIEEDVIKCLRPTYMGEFGLSGVELRKRGLNRIGNLIVPNKNYCDFEDWLTPLLHQMHDEQDQAWNEWTLQRHEQLQRNKLQQQQQTSSSSSSQKSNIHLDDENDDLRRPPLVWTPSRLIERLGQAIDHPDSVLYWAAKHGIPVFCPALTDGSLGDMLYFHSYQRPGFILDSIADIRRLNDLAVQSYATGMIILGGGLVKHHICNANLMRNGADFAVLINTAHEFDGSDSGASPDEAKSWGKVKATAQPVKVCADATLVFPLVVSQTFAKHVKEWKQDTKDCLCWLPVEDNI